MENVCMAQWYDTKNPPKNGYYLEGIFSERIYFIGNKSECEQYAKKNNIKIHYEC